MIVFASTFSKIFVYINKINSRWELLIRLSGN
jgi:hypothetical protein